MILSTILNGNRFDLILFSINHDEFKGRIKGQMPILDRMLFSLVKIKFLYIITLSTHIDVSKRSIAFNTNIEDETKTSDGLEAQFVNNI